MTTGRFLAAIIAVASLSLPAGCKLVPNDDGATAEGGVDIFFQDETFDAEKMARDLWDTRIVPYLSAKAGDFPDVIILAASDPDGAGAQFGHRENTEGAPWNLVTRLEGRIVAASLESRAATVDVDADGDGMADARLQVGPVIRGTALRDSLDFVPFGSFTNQIDYAQFGKALNAHVNATALGKLPRDSLVGRDVSVLGVFDLPSGGALPVVTPAQITVSEPSS